MTYNINQEKPIFPLTCCQEYPNLHLMMASHFAKFQGKEDNDKTVDSKKERRVEIQTKRKAQRSHTDSKESVKHVYVMSDGIENCERNQAKEH